MTVNSVVMVSIDAFGGQVTGKTLLMKRLFFVGELARLDLGYTAEYYGPHSAEVAAAVVVLAQHGLLDIKTSPHGVNRTGFETLRYEYTVTASGREAVKAIRAKNEDVANRISGAVDRIKKAGDAEYVVLSVAAKAYFLLKRAGREITRTGLATKMQEFCMFADCGKATEFLERLGVVQE